MMMNEPLSLILSWSAGVLIGAIFFGGLWWTVQKGLSSRHPAMWFLISQLLRMSFALTGFYLVAGGQWERLLACLVGFICARFVVARLTQSSGGHQSHSTTKTIKKATNPPTARKANDAS